MRKSLSEDLRVAMEDQDEDGSSSNEGWPTLGFEGALKITQLPKETNSKTQRYMSEQPAWSLGRELPGRGPSLGIRPGTYGGVVYAQASLAGARAVEQEEALDPGASAKGKLGIHSIQGVFTTFALGDRPFIHEVSPVQTGRSFCSRIIKSRQPMKPSGVPRGPFPLSDADLPMGDICFCCITTFKRSRSTPTEVQAASSAQERYKDILSSRNPEEWDVCPQVDIDVVRDHFPDAGPGAFPILEMHKVDMTGFNKDKPVPERRELLLYRPLKPIATDDVNGHIVCHAFEADRNGIIMLGNHIGYGYNLGLATSLTYSFYVHVNPEEAVMNDHDWWLQEIEWPRVSAGRCMMTSKIWDPQGKHVASAYQDGIILPYEDNKKGKL